MKIILTILAAITLAAGCTSAPPDNSSISILAREVADGAFDLVYGTALSDELLLYTCIEFHADEDLFTRNFIEGYNSTAAYDLSYHEDTEWVTSKFATLCS